MHTNISGNLLYKKKHKWTRNRKTWIQPIEHNIIILSLSAYYTHENGPSSSRSSTRKIWNKVDLRYRQDWQSAIKTEKWQMSWKKNWTPSLRSTEESTVHQNNFKVLNILYIPNFCETRKINSNTIWVLFLLLNFWKSRKYTLN